MYLRIILVIILICIPVFTTAHDDADGHDDGQIHIVEMTPEGFAPTAITIQQGDTIRFINMDERGWWPASNIHPTHRLYPHTDIDNCGTEDAHKGFDACTEIPPGQTYEFTFEHVGEWKTHDHILSRNRGVITVLPTEGYELTETAQATPTVLDRVKYYWQKITLWFITLYHSFFSESAASAITSVDMIAIAEQKGPELEYWVTEAGTELVMQALLDNSLTSGRDCHTAAHNVGRLSYELAGEAVFQSCSAECHSGCYHGGTEAYFRDHGIENLEANLNTICAADLNGFFTHQCIHGVGHGLMAWTDYEIIEALEFCDLLSHSQASCYSGVFMENVVGGLADDADHFTEYLSDDPHFPCNILPDQYIDSCYFYQTSRMANLFNGDMEKIAVACAEIDQTHQSSCFASMGRDVNAHYPEPTDALRICGAANTEANEINCLLGAIQNTFWDSAGQSDALNFCLTLTAEAHKTACYWSIYDRAVSVLPDEAAVANFCTKIETDYQFVCTPFDS